MVETIRSLSSSIPLYQDHTFFHKYTESSPLPLLYSFVENENVVLNEFVIGNDDVWDIIFSYLGGTPWRDSYISVLLSSKSFYDRLHQNDEFAFFLMRAFIRGKVKITPTYLPSLDFLTSKRGKYLCKYYCSTIDHSSLKELLNKNLKQIEVIKQLLKYYSWDIESVKKLDNSDLHKLGEKCYRAITIMTAHKDIDKQDIPELINLLDDCLDYSTTATLAGQSTIASCCDNLVKQSKLYRDMKSIVLPAVLHDGCALQRASDSLKSDREVVYYAVSNYGYTLRYACEELRKDKEIVLTAVKSYGYILQFSSEEARNDREIVLAAVSNNGYALEYAATYLHSDREIVTAAVKRYGCALRYASEKLRDDLVIVQLAVQNNRYALRYASKRLQDSEVFAEAKFYNDASGIFSDQFN
jgi:hypothetical protein